MPLPGGAAGLQFVMSDAAVWQLALQQPRCPSGVAAVVASAPPSGAGTSAAALQRSDEVTFDLQRQSRAPLSRVEPVHAATAIHHRQQVSQGFAPVAPDNQDKELRCGLSVGPHATLASMACVSRTCT